MAKLSSSLPSFSTHENEKEWVYLWKHATGKIGRYYSEVVRKAIHKLQDDSKASEILEAFNVQQRSDKEKTEAKTAKQIAELSGKHRKRLESRGLPWHGLSKPAKRPPRTAHCWSCKRYIDNSVNLECNTCGWILCRCGACGCGAPKTYK